MSGRIIYTPPVPTPCDRGVCEDRPSAENYRPGTVWKCDDCDREWVAVEGAQYNECYKAWRVLTSRNKDGIDR